VSAQHFLATDAVVKSCQNPLVAPFGGRTATDFAASPTPAEPGSRVASFVPELFCYAIKRNLLKSFKFHVSVPSVKT
jgi:hypothetical protein